MPFPAAQADSYGALIYDTITSTIANGGVNGSAVPVGDWEVWSIDVPTLTSSTFKIQGSLDGGTTWRDIYDGAGNQVLVWAASTGDRIMASRDCADFIGCTHIRPVCGSAQGAARSITFRYGSPKRS